MSITADVNGNLAVVSVNGDTLWFAYKTLVAFQVQSNSPVVIENCWGATTGKHLSSVDGGIAEAKRKRLAHQQFVALADSLKIDFVKANS